MCYTVRHLNYLTPIWNIFYNVKINNEVKHPQLVIYISIIRKVGWLSKNWNDDLDFVLSSSCVHICNIPMMLLMSLHIDYLAQAWTISLTAVEDGGNQILVWVLLKVMVLVKIQHKTVCVGTLNSEGLLQSKITTREDTVTGIQRTTISFFCWTSMHLTI